MKNLIALLLFPLIAFSSLKDSKNELLKIKDEIKKTQEFLNKIEEKKKKTQDRIREISQEKEKDKENLKRKVEDIKKIGKIKDATEEKIVTLTRNINSKKDGLSFMVYNLWLLKEENSLFFKNPSKDDALNVLINDLYLSIKKGEIEKKNFILKKEAIDVVLKKTEEEKRMIVSMIKSKDREIALENSMLKKAEKTKEEAEKRIAKLKNDQKRLEGLIARLEKEREKLPKKEPRRPVGSLIWPTESRNIVRPFGRYTHPDTGTILINKGIDISVRPGSPVFAIDSGEVVYADYFMGYENLIMIDHNGSLYSLYANLSNMNVKTQEKVTKGQIIGYTSEILHFEIRLDGKAQDPMDWL